MILIDEFSTGIDAAVKRDLWKLIKEMAPGKAFVITTRTHLPKIFVVCLSMMRIMQILWRRPPR